MGVLVADADALDAFRIANRAVEKALSRRIKRDDLSGARSSSRSCSSILRAWPIRTVPSG